MDKEQGILIGGWVARNSYGELYLYPEKPHRVKSGLTFGVVDMWSGGSMAYFALDKSLFPDITFESDPQEVEIIINRKKNE